MAPCVVWKLVDIECNEITRIKLIFCTEVPNQVVLPIIQFTLKTRIINARLSLLATGTYIDILLKVWKIELAL